VRDLTRAANHSRRPEGDPLDGLRSESKHVIRWLRDDLDKRLPLIVEGGFELRDELLLLLEDVRHRREEVPIA
jgi:hypothetical protein